MHYHSKYYKGEREIPLTFNSTEAFFWGYERSFYETARSAGQEPTLEEFNAWLDDLLANYLPDKMLSGYELPGYRERSERSFRRQYETGMPDFDERRRP